MNEDPSAPSKNAGTGALWRQSLAVQRERDTGFDGMLLFVALNRIFSPLYLGYLLFSYLQNLFQAHGWQALTNPSDSADRQWALFDVVGSFSATLGIAFDMILLWLFFLRRQAFRPAIIAFLLLGIALPSCLLGLSIMLGRFDLDSLFYAGTATLWGLFWIPYFFYSERVKNTFVR